MAVAAGVPPGIYCLPALSAALAAFSSAWSDLDSHFGSLNYLLDTLTTSLPSGSPELQHICHSGDGPALLAYLDLNTTSIPLVAAAVAASPSPAALVLAAVSDLCSLRSYTRKRCIKLLRELCKLDLAIPDDAKAEAKEVATEWKEAVDANLKGSMEIRLAFLRLIALFGLGREFKLDEVIQMVCDTCQREGAVDAFKALGLNKDKAIPVLIKKLRTKLRLEEAVKFITELGISNKYLKPMLAGYLTAAKKCSVRGALAYGRQVAKLIDDETLNLGAFTTHLQDFATKLEAIIKQKFVQKSKQNVKKVAEPMKRKRVVTVLPTSNSATWKQSKSQRRDKRPRLFTPPSVSEVPLYHNSQPKVIYHSQPRYSDYHSSFGVASSRYLQDPAAGPSRYYSPIAPSSLNYYSDAHLSHQYPLAAGRGELVASPLPSSLNYASGAHLGFQHHGPPSSQYVSLEEHRGRVQGSYGYGYPRI